MFGDSIGLPKIKLLSFIKNCQSGEENGAVSLTELDENKVKIMEICLISSWKRRYFLLFRYSTWLCNLKFQKHCNLIQWPFFLYSITKQ